MRRSRPARMIVAATAADEQAWNAQALVEAGEARWRIWSYTRPAVVLGASQRAGVAGQAGLPALTRRAGGGAVLVGPWMLGLSLVLPAGHPLADSGPLAAYRWLGERLATALRRDGVVCQVYDPAAPVAHLAPVAHRPDAAHWACFGSVSPGEVLCEGRKLAGLAQVRTARAVLLVAGVLVETPEWSLLCDALGRDRADADWLAAVSISWREARHRHVERGRPGPGLSFCAPGGDRAMLAGRLAPLLDTI